MIFCLEISKFCSYLFCYGCCLCIYMLCVYVYYAFNFIFRLLILLTSYLYTNFKNKKKNPRGLTHSWRLECFLLCSLHNVFLWKHTSRQLCVNPLGLFFSMCFILFIFLVLHCTLFLFIPDFSLISNLSRQYKRAKCDFYNHHTRLICPAFIVISNITYQQYYLSTTFCTETSMILF